jgi:hypothetical protein
MRAQVFAVAGFALFQLAACQGLLAAASDDGLALHYHRKDGDAFRIFRVSR